MSIILDGLKYLAYILIFPGFLFCFLSGLLLCGAGAAGFAYCSRSKTEKSRITEQKDPA